MFSFEFDFEIEKIFDNSVKSFVEKEEFNEFDFKFVKKLFFIFELLKLFLMFLFNKIFFDFKIELFLKNFILLLLLK